MEKKGELQFEIVSLIENDKTESNSNE